MEIGHTKGTNAYNEFVTNYLILLIFFPGNLSIPVVLKTLYTLGIHSVMVEGGAQVIRSFLSQDAQAVDTIIVTVAPTFVGEDGVSYNVASSEVCIIHCSISNH